MARLIPPVPRTNSLKEMQDWRRSVNEFFLFGEAIPWGLIDTSVTKVDISDDTNLTVTSPITLTLDDVGFDFSTNNTWTGTFIHQNASDSTTAFQVLDADGGTPILNIDTTNERVGIGVATPEQALDVNGLIQTSIAGTSGGIIIERTDGCATALISIAAATIMMVDEDCDFGFATNTRAKVLTGVATGRDEYFFIDSSESRIDFYHNTRITTNINLEFRDTDLYITSNDDGHLDLTADVSIDMNALTDFGTNKAQFRDSAIGIYSQADTFLDLFADGAVRIGDSSGGAPTNYLDIQPDGEIQLVGTARIKKHIHLVTETFRPGVASPTEALIGHFPVLQFSNVVTQTADTTFHVPEDWDTTTDMVMHVHWAPINGNAGDVVWDYDYKSVASEANEVITGSQRSLTITDSTQTLQDEHLKTADVTIPAGDVAALDVIGICVSRDTGDGADTYGSAASLIMVEIIYIANQLGEST